MDGGVSAPLDGEVSSSETEAKEKKVPVEDLGEIGG